MSETDFYSLQPIEFVLKLLKDRQMVVLSTLKVLYRLGDGVAIALIKVLDDQMLLDPNTIKSFLALIREGFSAPEFIVRKEDRTPKVTMLLLKHLRQNTDDVEVQRDLEELIETLQALKL